MKSFAFLVIGAGNLVLSSCALVPANGPQATTLALGTAGNSVPQDFEIVDLEPAVVKAIKRVPTARFRSAFGSGGPLPVQRIGVGDVVAVTIWEAAGGGLFTGSVGENTGVGSRSTTLPPQTVDRNGTIKVPYGGRIGAAGKTTAQVAAEVEAGLKGNAINPQAIVNVIQADSTAATVVGNVTGSASVPLSIKGDRLLEVVAKAGGIKSPTVETFIRMTRGNRTVVEPLSIILEHPAENVFVKPGDSIYVFSTPQTFTALGAVTHSGDLPVDRENFTLADALGAAGGLIDLQADARGVFLFRFERPEVLRAIRGDSSFLAKDGPPRVIYRLQLTDADSYFSAKSFPVQPEDLIYVSNAPSVDFMKFVFIARQLASTVRLIKGNSVANVFE
jgi:polysaccharide biosynthesis/export protein